MNADAQHVRALAFRCERVALLSCSAVGVRRARLARTMWPRHLRRGRRAAAVRAGQQRPVTSVRWRERVARLLRRGAVLVAPRRRRWSLRAPRRVAEALTASLPARLAELLAAATPRRTRGERAGARDDQESGGEDRSSLLHGATRERAAQRSLTPVAPGAGLEPAIAVSETAALPLGHPGRSPTCRTRRRCATSALVRAAPTRRGTGRNRTLLRDVGSRVAPCAPSHDGATDARLAWA